MGSEPLRHEKYTHGHAPATVRQHGKRTAEEAAAFMLPSLRPGMRLLDVGCGPGSITRGLAQRLAPDEVVGLDLSRDTLAAAREEAAQRGLTNLTYVEGSVYQLPFPDASFDAAYAQGAAMTLPEATTYALAVEHPDLSQGLVRLSVDTDPTTDLSLPTFGSS